MAKAEREKKVFIDYLRNAHGATAVCAFSTRSRPGRTVSVPVEWDELSRLDPAKFTIDSVPKRLARLKHDPWAEYWKARPRLPIRV
jgi:bifunctional non-homologous end joining protein LigD